MLRAVAAGTTLAAAIIHFSFAPAHLDMSASHGAFFLTAGWLQLVAALALGFGVRPVRAWAGFALAVNAAIAGTWVVSRTTGVPGSGAEAVGFPDTLATVLEVVGGVAAVGIVLAWTLASRLPRLHPAYAAVPGLVIVGLVTASVSPAMGGGHAHDDDHAHAASNGEVAAGDHAHGDGDTDHHDEPQMASGAEDWDAHREAALTGYASEDEIERFRAVTTEYLADQIRERSDALAGLSEAEREERIATFVEWTVDNALDAENGGHGSDDDGGMHAHGIDEWQPITDPDAQAELQAQLSAAATVIPRMATAADAMEAGYIQVTPYVPGIAAHYLNVALLRDGFDPAAPEMLLYNGNEPTSELVGVSYGYIGDEPPEGFVGDNDSWHVHPSLCILGSLVVGPDHTPDDLCESIGGRKGMGFGAPMQMAHLWQVPGWESPWGLFSSENPSINIATSDILD
jgi:hypothetical protein